MRCPGAKGPYRFPLDGECNGKAKEEKCIARDVQQVQRSAGSDFPQRSGDVTLAGNCREARAALRWWPVDVVVSELSLDDGTWWTVKKELLRSEAPAILAVSLPHADGGVTDLLEVGCTAVSN